MLRHKFLLVIAICCLTAFNAFAETTHKAPIHRSNSGGSGMADIIKHADTAKTEADLNLDNDTAALSEADRAMISKQALEQEAVKDEAAATKHKQHIPLSRSGGSSTNLHADLSK